MRSLKCSSRWLVMIAHTVVALLVMALCRLLYYRYNIDAFDFVPVSHLPRLFLGGAHLDYSMICYGCLVYYVMMIAGAYLPARIEESKAWRISRGAFYILPMAILILANVADTGYFPYVLTRATPNIFVEFEGEDMGALSASFIVQFWPLTLAYFLLLGLLIVGYLSIRLRGGREGMERILGTVAAAALLFLGMRGTLNFADRPLDESMVDRYVASFRETPIVQNTPYTLTRHSGTHFRPVHFFDEEELREIFDPTITIGPLSEEDSLFGCLSGRNVMILTMESLAREYTGYLNREIPGYESYTPFLDSLMPHTLYAKYGYASGKRSVESMPSVYASIPTFGAAFNDENFRMDSYQHARYFTDGLPTALREAGYDLKFYHGDEPGAMGFYDFLHGMGVEQQFTEADFTGSKEDYALWGVYDDPFMQAMAPNIGTLKRPFGALFFSLSNHNPFKLPKSLAGRYRKGTLPIHRTCQYADEALRRFFERIKEEPWFDRTIFVITGNHTSLSDRPEYDCPAGRSMVPICFYAPGADLEGEIADRVVSHADIYPTLLYLLGIKRTMYAYGRNLFDDRAEHVALNYLYGRYFLFTKELSVSIGLDGKPEVLAPSTPIQTDGPAELPDATTQQHYSDLLRAIVQDYNSRIFSGDFVYHR